MNIRVYGTIRASKRRRPTGLIIMKKVFVLLLALLMLTAPGCVKNKAEEPSENKEETMPTENKEDNMPTENTKVTATIVVKNFGTIELELYPEIAPQSVYNFCSLARKGFYNGAIFHRVIAGFMIQGGDPTGTGYGGPGYCIKGEFDKNGFNNPLKHTRGVISMARATPLDSAGCQFFIMHQDAPHLDGAYAAFGKVTSGIEVVDAIASVPVGAANRPVEDVVIESITIEGPELPEPEKLPEI